MKERCRGWVVHLQNANRPNGLAVYGLKGRGLAVSRFGMLTKAPNTGLPIQSPYLPIVNKQAQIMLNAFEQIGFSPASGTRIQVVEYRPREPSGWDAVDAG